MPKIASRRYRCTYRPLTIDGFPTSSESGLEPFVDVEATNADEAARLAFTMKACPITETTRLDGPQPRANRAPRKARPVIQLMTGAAMLEAMKAIADRKAA